MPGSGCGRLVTPQSCSCRPRARRRSRMKVLIRLFACGGLLATLLITVACLTCNASGGPGAQWLGGANPIRRLVDEQRRTAELEGRRADGLGRLAFLEETMHELIADWLTL